MPRRGCHDMNEVMTSITVAYIALFVCCCFLFFYFSMIILIMLYV